jgi:hypothetical protein
MALPEVKSEGVSIVFVGSFNPAIFQPSWFSAQGLLRAGEAEAAEATDVTVISNEVTVFSVDWLRVEVIHERFLAATTRRDSYGLLRDLVLGTFAILEHTPVTQVGLNRERHFAIASQADRDRFGWRLAPAGPWTAALHDPKMRSLTMEGQRTDGRKGYIHVKVEPSARIQDAVFVAVNDHYEIEFDDDAVRSALPAMSILKEQWDSFLAGPDTMAQAIFEGAS